MNKPASETELSQLHAKVAAVLVKQLNAANEAERLLAEHAGELPEDVVKFLCDHVDASPALLGVAIKFLKDNSITAVAEDSKELTELEQKLNKKKERKVVGNVVPMISADDE